MSSAVTNNRRKADEDVEADGHSHKALRRTIDDTPNTTKLNDENEKVSDTLKHTEEDENSYVTSAEKSALETDNTLNILLKTQGELNEVNLKADEEIVQIEQKYMSIRAPILRKRQQVLDRIPLFWRDVICSHPDLTVTPLDKELLGNCTSLYVELEDLTAAFRILMTFQENKYFEDKQLIKMFTGDGEEGLFSPPASIQWKGDHQPEDLWFFNWIANTNIDKITHDAITDIIKDDIWHNPVQYYKKDTKTIHTNDNGDEEEVDETEAIDELLEYDETDDVVMDNGDDQQEDMTEITTEMEAEIETMVNEDEPMENNLSGDALVTDDPEFDQVVTDEDIAATGDIDDHELDQYDEGVAEENISTADVTGADNG